MWQQRIAVLAAGLAVASCGLVINLDEEPKDEGSDGDVDVDVDTDVDVDADTDTDTGTGTEPECETDFDCIEDEDPCTVEKCIDGGCVVHGRPCEDEIACTTDLCDAEAQYANPDTGCVHVPDHAFCNERNACAEELCRPGSDAADEAGCVLVEETVCEVGEADCALDAFCDPESGECALVAPEDAGVACPGGEGVCVPGEGCQPQWTARHCMEDADCGAVDPGECGSWDCAWADWLGANRCRLEAKCPGEGCLEDGTCVPIPGG